MSSTKKRVTFKDPENQNNDDTGEGDVKVRKLTSVRYDHEYQEDDYYSDKIPKTDDDDDGEDYVEEENRKQAKHSLDSDEEDNAEKIPKLKKNVLNEFSKIEEPKTSEFDDEIKLTPFNMKEELEEGDLDTDGYYHFKSKKGEVHDAWLDNIDWANINEIKKFKGQDNLLNAASKSGVIRKNYDLTAGDNIDDDQGEDDDDKSSNESFTGVNLNQNEQIELFKKILDLMKPGESILKSIKRLGSKAGSASKANLSASQRWIKKKQVDTSDEAKADAESLEKLTSLANKFIDMGFYDIYEETYEKIKLKLDEEKEGDKETKKDEEEFDMFSENVEIESSLPKGSTSKATNIIEDKIVKWIYKLSNSDEDKKIFGPFNSEEMLKMSLDGKFDETGVWCRRVDDESSSFYNSKRIDFDLYT